MTLISRLMILLYCSYDHELMDLIENLAHDIPVLESFREKKKTTAESNEFTVPAAQALPKGRRRRYNHRYPGKASPERIPHCGLTSSGSTSESGSADDFISALIAPKTKSTSKTSQSKGKKKIQKPENNGNTSSVNLVGNVTRDVSYLDAVKFGGRRGSGPGRGAPPPSDRNPAPKKGKDPVQKENPHNRKQDRRPNDDDLRGMQRLTQQLLQEEERINTRVHPHVQPQDKIHSMLFRGSQKQQHAMIPRQVESKQKPRNNSADNQLQSLFNSVSHSNQHQAPVVTNQKPQNSSALIENQLKSMLGLTKATSSSHQPAVQAEVPPASNINPTVAQLFNSTASAQPPSQHRQPRFGRSAPTNTAALPRPVFASDLEQVEPHPKGGQTSKNEHRDNERRIANQKAQEEQRKRVERQVLMQKRQEQEAERLKAQRTVHDPVIVAEAIAETFPESDTFPSVNLVEKNLQMMHLIDVKENDKTQAIFEKLKAPSLSVHPGPAQELPANGAVKFAADIENGEVVTKSNSKSRQPGKKSKKGLSPRLALDLSGK